MKIEKNENKRENKITNLSLTKLWKNENNTQKDLNK